MAIAQRGTPISATGTASAANIAVTKPTGVVAGDVWIISGQAHKAALTGITAPTGFTTILNNTSAITNAVLFVFIRECDGTEGGSVNVAQVGTTTADYGIGSEALSGVNTTTQQDATATTASNSSGTGLQCTSITTVTAAARVMGFAFWKATPATLTAPTGYTKEIDAENTTATSSVASFEANQAAAGASGTFKGVFTSPGASFCVTIALRPAATGETGTANFAVGATAFSAAGTPGDTGAANLAFSGTSISVTGRGEPIGAATMAFAGASYAATGAPKATGAASLAFGGVSYAVAGGRAETGAVTLSFGGPAFAAAGTLDIPGAVNLAFTGVSYAASGTLRATGAASLAFGGISLVVSGAPSAIATASLGFGGISMAAAGSPRATGSASLVFAGVAYAASGALEIVSTAAMAFSGIGLGLSGNVSGGGESGAVTMAFSGISFAVSGAMTVTGTVDLAFQGAAFAVAGAGVVTGAAILTFAGASFSAVGLTGGPTGTVRLSFGGIAIIASGFLTAGIPFNASYTYPFSSGPIEFVTYDTVSLQLLVRFRSGRSVMVRNVAPTAAASIGYARNGEAYVLALARTVNPNAA